MPPKEAIEEFKQIYKQVFQEELDDVDATQRANRLLELYKAVLDPLSSNFRQQ